MSDYKLTTGTSITRTSDGAAIPADPRNMDYQQYLTWVAAGNTPDPYPTPVLSLPDAQAAQVALLDVEAATAYTSGFLSSASGTPMWYDSDQESQFIYGDLSTDAKMGIYQTTVYFPGYPVGVSPIRGRVNQNDPASAKVVELLTQSQFLQLYSDWKTAFTTIKAQLWVKQQQVYSATTVADVQAITWQS